MFGTSNVAIVSWRVNGHASLQRPLDSGAAGFPELTDLGKRIEVLRIARGISKQHLARFAGTSRQQLWRVITGKSEMSLALRTRLADALKLASLNVVDAHETRSPSSADLQPSAVSRTRAAITATSTATETPSNDLRAYVARPTLIASTLATLPTGDHGRVLKRRLLEAIEDAAIDAGLELDHAVFELRRKVLSGQL